MLEIKSFGSSKNESLLFWFFGRGYVSRGGGGGGQFSKVLRGDLTYRLRIFGGGLGKKG